MHETIAAFEEVNEILRLLTMHLGPDAVLVNAEIHVLDGLDTDQLEGPFLSAHQTLLFAGILEAGDAGFEPSTSSSSL